MTWRDQAMCRGYDPDIFFPNVGLGGSNATLAKQITAAKRVCSMCPVDLECLDFALQPLNTCRHTCIMGGLTYQERVNVLNARVTA